MNMIKKYTTALAAILCAILIMVSIPLAAITIPVAMVYESYECVPIALAIFYAPGRYVEGAWNE